MPVKKTRRATRKVLKKRRPEALYHCTVEGTYFSQEGEKKSIKPYLVEVNLSSEMVKHGALSMFVKHIAPFVMPKHYPDFMGLHTFKIIKTQHAGGAKITKLELMNWFDLCAHVEEHDLDVYVELYHGDEDALRKAIEACQLDPSGYRLQEKRLMELRKDGIAMRRRAQALNAIGAGKSAPKPLTSREVDTTDYYEDEEEVDEEFDEEYEEEEEPAPAKPTRKKVKDLDEVDDDEEDDELSDIPLVDEGDDDEEEDEDVIELPPQPEQAKPKRGRPAKAPTKAKAKAAAKPSRKVSKPAKKGKRF